MENQENEMQRAPLSPENVDKVDLKGNPRMTHEMPRGGTFYGSQEEYGEELRKLREEAK